MIVEGSEVRHIGKTGVSYFTVMRKCDECGAEKVILKQRAKINGKLCGTCCRKTPEYRAIREESAKKAGIKMRHIRCLIPCLYCGKNQSRRKRHLEQHPLTFCNSSCQNKWQHANTDFNKGVKNPKFKDGSRVGGKTPNYGPEFGKDLKRRVKIRDGFNCQECLRNFSGERSKKLDVHHIDENKFNNDMNNLLSLCKCCHTKLHHGQLGKTTKLLTGE